MQLWSSIKSRKTFI